MYFSVILLYWKLFFEFKYPSLYFTLWIELDYIGSNEIMESSRVILWRKTRYSFSKEGFLEIVLELLLGIVFCENVNYSYEVNVFVVFWKHSCSELLNEGINFIWLYTGCSLMTFSTMSSYLRFAFGRKSFILL